MIRFIQTKKGKNEREKKGKLGKDIKKSVEKERLRAERKEKEIKIIFSL